LDDDFDPKTLRGAKESRASAKETKRCLDAKPSEDDRTEEHARDSSGLPATAEGSAAAKKDAFQEKNPLLKKGPASPGEVGVFFDRDDVASALGVRRGDVDGILGRNALGDVFISLVSTEALRKCEPDARMIRFLTKGGRGLVVTAPGGEASGADGGAVAFSCRFFGPNIGVEEDPVTGSAFCGLAPYWRERLGRKIGEEMVTRQMSSRGGVVRVAVVKTRGVSGDPDETKVRVRGRAVSVLKGEILADGFDPEEE
jgi:predicted PhzF superfamily epimerase YddE/YHI9